MSDHGHVLPVEPAEGDEVIERRIVLRDEDDEVDRRHLDARVDAQGRLRIDGHDRGPATRAAQPASDGEYEWFTTYAADDVPRIVELLGGDPGDDVLDLLEQRFTGPASYDLERLLRESDLPVERSVWF